MVVAALGGPRKVHKIDEEIRAKAMERKEDNVAEDPIEEMQLPGKRLTPKNYCLVLSEEG